MHIRPPHRARSVALLAATAAAGALTLTTPAQAVIGDAVADSAYAFTAQIQIGEGDTSRACTGSLVDAQYVLTASSCFAAAGQPAFPVPAGAPAEKATATIGRRDLTGTAGQVVEITELVPRADRDLVMAKLATPVTDITPALLAATPPTAGETLQAVGYGRTADTWVPDRLHAGAFTVTQADATTVAVTRDGGSICKGDAGGPALRETNGKAELVAVHSASWQAGCLGSEETRTGAVETRLDDITEWVQQVRALPGESQVTSGDFNADGREDIAAFYDNGTSPEGKNRSSLFAFYATSTGFAAPKNVWSTPGGFTWSKSKLTAGDFDGDGKDDVAVFYDSGTSDTGAVSSLYTFTSTGTGFKAPRKSWTTTGGFNWAVSKVTSGDYNGDGKDDVAVFYDNGTSDTGAVSSLYTFTSNGTDFTARKTWTTTGGFTWSAGQVTSGDYNKDGKDDVAVLYNGGKSADGKFVSSLYTFLSDGTVFNNPRKSWTSSGSFNWSASKLTSGDYSGDGRADIGILYNRGTTAEGVHQSALFTLTSDGTDFAAPREAWTSTGSFSWAASQPVSGDFNKDGKDDIGVLYRSGTTADGRRIDSLFSFTSTGTDVQAPVRHWSGSVV
ncbi:FG-GAP-like repeat-containing protein [Streptomyces sp. NPDC052071]|uniref:FG-GAP-like repeat-containing protein n=1 Tax=unclassified Streptomyces TaxID=2593676 RepID=UPI0029A3C16A|nr:MULTISPECIES: FG-GAP-like repeat-containing protein [unclassified Streptomyces]MDX3182759.1 FG-GAP-like repeat-containing protein [Streptomyces sp. ME02-7008A-1]